MKATHDYVGKDDSELTFKEGDTIMVPAPEMEGNKSMIKGGRVCTERTLCNDTWQCDRALSSSSLSSCLLVF